MATFQLQITSFAQDREVTQEMFKILQYLLQSPTYINADTAAAWIHRLHLEYRAEHPEASQNTASDVSAEDHATKTFLWEFWDLVFALAMQIPVDNPAQKVLAYFVQCLKEIPTPVIEIEGQSMWKDLPRLGWVACEAHNDVKVGTQEELNLYGFAARLTRNNTRSFCDWALWTLRNALEDELDWKNPAYFEQGPVLNILVPLAAQWISLIGPILYRSYEVHEFTAGRLCKENHNFRGCCPERWALWKMRFGEISNCDQASEDTRRIAKEAEETMRDIEDSRLE